MKLARERAFPATSLAAGDTNIGVGVNYAYGFFLCDLSIPGNQAVAVEVVVFDAAVYWKL